MNEFLYIIRSCKDDTASKSPEELQMHLQKWQVWMNRLTEESKLISGKPLMKEGKTIIDGGEKVIDRPLVEGKELIGGYLLIKAENLEEATEIAKGCPILELDATIEVREILSL